MRTLFNKLIAKGFGYSQEMNEYDIDNSLRKVLQNAYDYIPYYRRLFIDYEVTLDGKIQLQKFQQIPFLDKSILREKSNDLIAKNLNMKSTYWNTSGGSTGEPVRFLQDKEYRRASRAITYQQKSWAGYQFGDPMIKLWGDEREIFSGSRSIKSKVATYVKNITFLNAFAMSPENMTEYIKIIYKIKPILIVAYAQSMYELCKFAEEKKFIISDVGAIMTSAGTLYPFMRETIERVCNVKVFNRYGTREVGNIASECEKHEGMHVTRGTYIEIIGEDGKPCPPDTEGEIVVTTLINNAMPLIRYRIGDRGIMSGKSCSCGRSGQLLSGVTGRMTDSFKSPTGKVVPAEYFIHIIGVVLNKGGIRKFQVIQKSFKQILVKIIQTNLLSKNDLIEIENKIKLVMGNDCEVVFEYVEQILPLKSGKYRYTISELN